MEHNKFQLKLIHNYTSLGRNYKRKNVHFSREGRLEGGDFIFQILRTNR